MNKSENDPFLLHKHDKDSALIGIIFLQVEDTLGCVTVDFWSSKKQRQRHLCKIFANY